MDIAATLKEFRQQHDLEQADLAGLLGTTQQTISNWEAGTVPRASALRRINHLLTTYKAGEGAPPIPPKPVLHPQITEFHEIKTGDQARRVSADALAKLVEPRRSPELTAPAASRLAHDAFFAALPVSLPYQRNAAIDFQSYRTFVDYLDPDVCAEFKFMPENTARPSNIALTIFAERAIQHLVTVRRVLELQNKPRKVFAVIVCHPESLWHYAAFGRAMTVATLHDIRLIPGQSPEQCAANFLNMLHEVSHSVEDHDFPDDET